MAAAHRIPWILELAGLFLVGQQGSSKAREIEVPGILETLPEVLAEEEHDLCRSGIHSPSGPHSRRGRARVYWSASRGVKIL